jgi:SNF2 family DNA or RNA helicase
MFLDLIEYKIKDERLAYLRFDGSMNKQDKSVCSLGFEFV